MKEFCLTSPDQTQIFQGVFMTVFVIYHPNQCVCVCFVIITAILIALKLYSMIQIFITKKFTNIEFGCFIYFSH